MERVILTDPKLTQIKRDTSVEINTRVGVLRIVDRGGDITNGFSTDYDIMLTKVGATKEEFIGDVLICNWTLSSLEQYDKRSAQKFKELGLKAEDKIMEINQFKPMDKAPELEGKGIGTAVLTALLDKFKAEGVSGVYVAYPITEEFEKRLLSKERFNFQKGIAFVKKL